MTVRILYYLYWVDRREGARWVRVGEIAVALQAHFQSVRRGLGILAERPPRDALSKNPNTYDEWRIAERGRETCRAMDRAVKDALRAAQTPLPAVLSVSTRSGSDAIPKRRVRKPTKSRVSASA